MPRSRFSNLWFAFLLLALVALACNLSGGELEPAAELVEVVPEVVTVVVVATETPAPEEPAPADIPVIELPTAAPGEPTMTALVDLNVRRGPGTQYGVVGALRAGSSARIVGKSPDGFWWKIECPAGSGPECWSSAGIQFSTAVDVTNVAVAAVPPAPTHPPATATLYITAVPGTPTATLPPAEATATQAAILTASPTATATGTTTATPTATQVGQPTATQVGQPTATATQPGQPTATTSANTPTATATTAVSTATPTPTATTAAVPVAPFDNDSLQNPAVSVFFSPTGTRNFTHDNDISFPNGDQDDWVRFEFPNASNSSQSVWITLDCNILGSDTARLRATIWVNNQATNQTAGCNQGEISLTVNNTQVQYVRVHFNVTAGDNQIYSSYSLRVVGYR